LQAGPQAQKPLEGRQPAQRVWLPRALAFRLQPLASEAPKAWPVQPPAACVRLSLPHPSLLFPLWPWLPLLLPRPLTPEDVCAPSPQHPRESSWSASSFR
jgi:hypothetical protein